jgi:phosphoserine phosphatase RsbU/P
VFLVSVVVAWALVNRISQPLNLLAAHVTTLAAHDFSNDSKVPADIEALSRQSKDEIGNLASSFVHMQRALEQNIRDLRDTTAAKQRIESELLVAQGIQMTMVPKIFAPMGARCDLFGALVPAREVGGDFYDFGFVDEDHLVLAIGDVAGKGVPAALFMAMTTTLLRSLRSQFQHPADMLARLNDELCRGNTTSMFVTVFVAVLDLRTGSLEYSNGGHNLPYLLSDGTVRALENTADCLVLGAFEGVTYGTTEVVLRPGDRLLFYTDGVTEAMNADQHAFSEERLVEYLAVAGDAAPEALTGELRDVVRRFTGEIEQSDDITVLAVRYLGH